MCLSLNYDVIKLHHTCIPLVELNILKMNPTREQASFVLKLFYQTIPDKIVRFMK